MNILFLKSNEYIQDELQEYLKDMQGNAHFADDIEEAMNMLHSHPFDVAVLNVNRIADIRLLKYIHQYFSNIRIVLVIEKNVENAISAIKNTQFKILPKPFTLEEFGEIVKQEKS